MQGIPAYPGKAIPPYLVRWIAMVEQRPLRAAARLGACMGLVGVLCSFVIAKAVFHLVPPEQWGNSAAAGLGRLGPIWMFFAAVVFAPVIETLLGQVLPMETARRLGAKPVVQVLLSGLVFGYGHYVNGGLAHGITTFFGGAIFASAYAALRTAGVWPACIAAGTAHAVQNGIAITIILFFGDS